jgi:hypothetical protein
MIQKLIIDSKKVSFRKKISNFLTRFILYVYWENLLDIIVLPTFSVALNLSPNLGVGKYTQNFIVNYIKFFCFTIKMLSKIIFLI